MDRFPQIPPELLMGMPAGPAPGQPGFIDAPSEDPMLRQMQAQSGQGIVDGGMSDPMANMIDPIMQQLSSPLAQGLPPQAPMQGPGGGQDPVLMQLMQQIQQTGQVVNNDEEKERRAKVRKPTLAEIEAIANRDQEAFQPTIDRMGRDVAMFRQDMSALPKSFVAGRDTAIKSAQFSTLVNKLSNMFSSVDLMYEVPYDTTDQEKSAQIIEDALYQLRKLAKRQYYQGNGGGNLQRDEFFYMFLHGRYAKRILPDLRDKRNPYQIALVDPSTVFPTWGGGKKGLIRVIHRYETSVGELISEYGEAVPKLEEKLAKSLGYENYSSASEYLDERGEVIEYWDSWYRAVTFKAKEVMPVTAHKLGFVPWSIPMPMGEPASMATPGGRYWSYDTTNDTQVPIAIGPGHDKAQKGVSVYHYLVNTHRVKEMLATILYNEVEKAADPATIEYVAPHLGGEETPPLDTKRGGTNRRKLNFQKIEGIPTSPRPTDYSPVLSMNQQEMVEGSFPPGMYGAEQGSNVTGSGSDAMMRQAKDLVAPYITAWELGQAYEAFMMLQMYVDVISPIITIRAPAHDPRGDTVGDVYDLSPFDIEQVGTFVEVKMTGLTMQDEAQQIASMGQAVSNGFYSQRHAMAKLNVKNPDKMFAEIIAEKAMQHPALMDNFIIPEGFIARGDEDMARLWAELVIAPQLMQMQGAMMQPQGGGGQGSQAAPNPLQGIMEQAPGGAPPGQGRGPSQGEPEGMI